MYNDNDGKKWYHSKTMWFNLVTGTSAIASNLIAEGGLSPQMNSALATFVMIGNMVLRAITDQPIEK